MKKQFKYRLRRAIFMHTPFTAMWIGIGMLAFIQAGIYVI